MLRAGIPSQYSIADRALPVQQRRGGLRCVNERRALPGQTMGLLEQNQQFAERVDAFMSTVLLPERPLDARTAAR